MNNSKKRKVSEETRTFTRQQIKDIKSAVAYSIFFSKFKMFLLHAEKKMFSLYQFIDIMTATHYSSFIQIIKVKKKDICCVILILDVKRVLRLSVFSLLWETGLNGSLSV